MKKCKYCNNPLPENAHPYQLYCSEKCRSEMKNIKRRERRKKEYKERPNQICLRCGKEFKVIKPGPRFYCFECSILRKREREIEYYEKRIGHVEKRYCPKCGTLIRKKTETFCSRCRKKYKILR